MRLPTVRLKHKRKGKIITVNESDWAQDLGLFMWRDWERVGERHNGATAPLEASTKPPPADVDESLPETAPRRRRGRPRKNTN